MTTIDPDGNELVWTAHYWRYQSLESAECDSLEEAVHFLAHGEDAGNLSSDSVTGPGGAVVHDFKTGGIGNTIWAYADSLRDGQQPDRPRSAHPAELS